MKGGGEVARGATTAAHHSHPSLSMLLRGHTPHPVTAAEIVQVGGGAKTTTSMPTTQKPITFLHPDIKFC